MGAGQSTSFAGISKTASGITTFDNTSTNWSTIASEFLTAGNVPLWAKTLTTTTITQSSGNGSAAQVTTAGLRGSITFTYTVNSATPEPATMFLMGSALLGVGLLRKRIRS